MYWHFSNVQKNRLLENVQTFHSSNILPRYPQTKLNIHFQTNKAIHFITTIILISESEKLKKKYIS